MVVVLNWWNILHQVWSPIISSINQIIYIALYEPHVHMFLVYLFLFRTHHKIRVCFFLLSIILLVFQV